MVNTGPRRLGFGLARLACLDILDVLGALRIDTPERRLAPVYITLGPAGADHHCRRPACRASPRAEFGRSVEALRRERWFMSQLPVD